MTGFPRTKIENLLGNSVFTPGENSEEFVIKTLDETSNGAVSLEEYTTSEGNSSQILDGLPIQQAISGVLIRMI